LPPLSGSLPPPTRLDIATYTLYRYMTHISDSTHTTAYASRSGRFFLVGTPGTTHTRTLHKTQYPTATYFPTHTPPRTTPPYLPTCSFTGSPLAWPFSFCTSSTFYETSALPRDICFLFTAPTAALLLPHAHAAPSFYFPLFTLPGRRHRAARLPSLLHLRWTPGFASTTAPERAVPHSHWWVMRCLQRSIFFSSWFYSRYRAYIMVGTFGCTHVLALTCGRRCSAALNMWRLHHLLWFAHTHAQDFTLAIPYLHLPSRCYARVATQEFGTAHCNEGESPRSTNAGAAYGVHATIPLTWPTTTWLPASCLHILHACPTLHFCWRTFSRCRRPLPPLPPPRLLAACHHRLQNHSNSAALCSLSEHRCM